ncbi:GNAT family N-acetyltransferase [Paraburkholderia metrosideri]|uniref:GNAT family N-acetyltransferase n=1 Tax=Paraburkholderia metrosideri TaxID=580937 RepID=A0ABW9DZR3_9BURK
MSTTRPAPSTAHSADSAATLPPTAPVIRDAAEVDLPAIQAIYAHHVLTGVASFEEIPPSVDDLRTRLASVRSHGLPYMVAEIGGEVAGYCYATPYRPRVAYRHTIEDSIYIGDAYRGRGLGRALLQALIERCETGPWRQMVAVIADGGSGGSLSLHTQLGFELTGTLKAVGFKHGRWLDTTLMQRTLGAGDSSLPDDVAQGHD